MDYKKFFGFKEAPFHLTPDPAYFFPSNAHREALQTLLYSIRAGEGFVQITGDPGTGKTLLIRTILRELGDDISTALIFNPRLSPHELLRTLLEDLGLDPAMMENTPREALLRRFRDFLMDKANKGSRVIVIIDEAQNLPMDTLEELRLLSNLETEKEKLLQIILVGQRELEAKLDLPEVRQLHQRITIRYQLDYLSWDDIQSYIYHRLKIATPEDQDITVKFTEKSLRAIYRTSKGVPRLINIISERSLMAAYVEGSKTVGVDEVKKALQSIRGNDNPDKKTLSRKRFLRVAALFFLVLGIGLLGTWIYKPDFPRSVTSLIHKDQATDVQVFQEELPPAEPAEPDALRGAVIREAPEAHEKIETVEAAAKPDTLISWDQELPVNADQPPREAFLVAPDADYIRVIIESGLVQIWRGQGDSAVLMKTVEHPWIHGQGLFMTGHDPDLGDYVFNHKAFLRGTQATVSSDFFNIIADYIDGNAVPLIAVNKISPVDREVLEQAAKAEPVFEQFIDNWENMRIEELFKLYGSVVSSHYLGQDKPLVWSWTQSMERKKEVFRRSGFINLGATRPVFMIDPTDSENIMTVYDQKYRSRIWEDDGTKVLYLSLQDTPQGKNWKIVAELWVVDL